ncbi:hypothetical protein Tsubulata_021271 [Turnera subulata]|uniref:AT-hook motif nuclear-localized protein n=1 Tax=Turnera subulata TaxID=218843 RepID=A0A9Q0FR39_9ROSI|nr:hypothetical protein Tsubulata_021271 [Turnera subulata]
MEHNDTTTTTTTTNPPPPPQQRHFAPYFTTGPPPTSATSPTVPPAAAATNGLLPPPPAPTPGTTDTTATAAAAASAGSHLHQQQQQQQQLMVFPHSVATPSVVAEQPPKRKRGRPRKYGTPEQALAAKKNSASSSSAARAEKREQQQQQHHHQQPGSPSYSSSSKKSSLHQLQGFGNVGHGFTPHVINVVAGEDVTQKIMLFLQQSKREMCILSASGSISNVSLRQPATSGGNIAYEGRFEIISLSGSYVRTDGGRTGGLSVCLSSTDGHIIGGGVGGPLKAAGPVQVIVGTFVLDNKKDIGAGMKGDASTSKLPSPVGAASVPNIGFRSPVETSIRNPIRGNDDHLAMGGNLFMQSGGIHFGAPRPTDWRGAPDPRTLGYELGGRSVLGSHQSPENGDYDQLSE